ncbi:Monoacylglycerol lipase ABHD12 [Eumeta japonica]|uniref:Monoacylglycerol lipase ABHD12 n=1 Tax=Eumeta variegata TaxID=151549 RepID=A0A4C1UL43_EUMVA|nr:Monoacylglycerol lipase ABHD12 [Eumeta japonica]
MHAKIFVADFFVVRGFVVFLDDGGSHSTRRGGRLNFECRYRCGLERRVLSFRLISVKSKRDLEGRSLATRGLLRYGDSTNVKPTEKGLVEDSLMVYEWLNNQTNKPLFVWGHSLGTGISSHLVGNLKELCTQVLGRQEPLPQPNGLILESPFNNMADEVAEHPLSKLVTWLPYYDATFVEPFRVSERYTFKSDEYLRNVNTLPILILHAQDDVIVPYVVGLKLYERIKQSREGGGATLKLHTFDSRENLGHKWICDAVDLPLVVGTRNAAGQPGRGAATPPGSTVLGALSSRIIHGLLWRALNTHDNAVTPRRFAVVMLPYDCFKATSTRPSRLADDFPLCNDSLGATEIRRIAFEMGCLDCATSAARRDSPEPTGPADALTESPQH